MADLFSILTEGTTNSILKLGILTSSGPFFTAGYPMISTFPF